MLFTSQNIDSSILSGSVRSGNDGNWKVILLIVATKLMCLVKSAVTTVGEKIRM